jgi:hypothetical protein
MTPAPLTADENARLMEILGTMRVPPMRLDPIDSGWLLRNIAVENFGRPELAEVIGLLRRVPRRGASR